jgi:hypothetical protein
MAAINEKCRLAGLFLLVLCLIGFMLSCGSSLKEQKNESPMSPVSSFQSAGSIKNSDRSDSRYYDFEDVKIPNELKLDEKKSNVYKSPEVKSGFLKLDGYVEVKSLLNFFKTNMVKDGWKLKADFKRPPQIILLFEKKDKRSLFFIEDATMNTHVEIWMIPTRD